MLSILRTSWKSLCQDQSEGQREDGGGGSVVREYRGGGGKRGSEYISLGLIESLQKLWILLN